jgi:hypothetical protein
MRKILNWIKSHYGDVPIYVTSNGVSDTTGKLNDSERVNFHREYIDEMLKGITGTVLAFDTKFGLKIYFTRKSNINFLKGFMIKGLLYCLCFNHIKIDIRGVRGRVVKVRIPTETLDSFM